MKLAQFLVCQFLFLFALTAATFDDSNERLVQFDQFKKRHRKKYNGTKTESRRFRRWKELKGIIDQHNKEATSNDDINFFLVDNFLADQTETEWDSKLFGVEVPSEFEEDESETDFLDTKKSNSVTPTYDRQVSPPSLDLRNNPCMPAVKLQSPCGGCWAFIATTSVEYQTCLRNGNRTALNLSEQQLIDCSRAYGTKGCSGGFYSQAWDYLMVMGGQTSTALYPYKAMNGTCAFNKNTTPIFGTVSKYTYLPKNESAILSALQKGPVTVSIVANSKFILYSTGIFDDDTCRNGTINHGVVVVGYGTANNTDYWIVRNSWGTSWGQSGYIFMKRNVNICRISEFAFLATF